MLHLRSDWVEVDALENFAGLAERMDSAKMFLAPERSVGFGWLSHDLHPEGICGNAGEVDAARGQKLLEHLTDPLAKLVNEVGNTPYGYA